MTGKNEIDELLTASVASARRKAGRLGPIGWAVWAVAALPAVALVLLASLAVRVRLADGVWPEFNAPDPKTLGVHYALAVAAFIAAFVSVVLTPILALLVHFSGRRVKTLWPLVAAVVGFASYLLVLRLDLGGLGTWFAD